MTRTPSDRSPSPVHVHHGHVVQSAWFFRRGFGVVGLLLVIFRLVLWRGFRRFGLFPHGEDEHAEHVLGIAVAVQVLHVGVHELRLLDEGQVEPFGVRIPGDLAEIPERAALGVHDLFALAIGNNVALGPEEIAFRGEVPDVHHLDAASREGLQSLDPPCPRPCPARR